MKPSITKLKHGKKLFTLHEMDTSVGVFWNFQDLSRGESWLTALLFQIVICHYHSLILLGVFLALKSICCIYSQSKKWNASRLATIATRIDSYAGGSSTHKLCRLHTAARRDLYYFTNTMNECRPWEIRHCLIWGWGSEWGIGCDTFFRHGV